MLQWCPSTYLSPTSSSSLTRFRPVVMPYNDKPALFKSFSILSIHCCFGHPTGRIPVGFQLWTMDGHSQSLETKPRCLTVTAEHYKTGVIIWKLQGLQSITLRLLSVEFSLERRGFDARLWPLCSGDEQAIRAQPLRFTQPMVIND